jgi:hypothetical protein
MELNGAAQIEETATQLGGKGKGKVVPVLN